MMKLENVMAQGKGLNAMWLRDQGQQTEPPECINRRLIKRVFLGMSIHSRATDCELDGQCCLCVPMSCLLISSFFGTTKRFLATFCLAYMPGSFA